MSTVIVTKAAAAAIARRYDHYSGQTPPGKAIPVLLWSIRSYFDDNRGNRATIGPKFYFHWTNDSEIEEYDYLKIKVEGVGEVALAPGALFRTGSHTIEAQDGTLVLAG